MQGMLLGLGDIIGSVFASVLGGLIELILTPLMDKVVVPVINMAINLAMEILGGFFYLIGVFVLALVDFTEMLFRVLAGLGPIAEGRPYATLSLDERSGDILIQLIRNPAIQEAFLSMCIVGLFLLVITTVFQIIKVEYITEGAKNAKGPIFQKAFKSLCNLILLPLLVVFGVFLANQVLGLLDTATRGEGKNPTISGQIFSVSASQAFYRENDRIVRYKDARIAKVISAALSSAVHILFDPWTEDGKESGFIKNETERGDILEKFVQQEEGHRYYNAKDVSNFFALSKINYIVLIFGGFTVLKCLFFTCVGMVIRLYKCAVLFIMAPVVIGMTPINEGGLGKWRTSFIGQVLSAYGVVISINLFFIIVRVLLNIKIKFEGIAGFALTADFLTELLKAIIVIAGVLMIEKFSKEIGGYFGAEDAMSAGKDMSKQVGDAVMKGVKAVAGVASGGLALAGTVAGVAGAAFTGGTSLALTGVSAGLGALGGIAGAVASKAGEKSSTPSGGDGANGEKSGGKAAKFANWAHNAQNAVKSGRSKTTDATLKALEFAGKKSGVGKVVDGIVGGGIEFARTRGTKSDLNWYNDRLTKHNDYVEKEKRQKELEEKKGSLEKEGRGAGDQEFDAVTSELESNASYLENNRSDKGSEDDVKAWTGSRDGLVSRRAGWEKRKERASQTILNTKSLITGLAEESKPILNPTHKLFDDLDKTMKKGAEINGDAYVVTYENKGAQEKKKTQDEASSGIWDALIKSANKGGFDISTDRMIDTYKHEQEKTRTALERALNNVSGGRWDDLNPTQQDSRLQSITSQAQAMGSSLTERQIEQLLTDKHGNVTLGDLKITMNADEVASQIKTIMSSNKSLDKKIDDLTALAKKAGAKGEEATVAGIIKAIEDLKSQLGGK